MTTIPSRSFFRSLRRQPPAPDLIKKLQKGFPKLGVNAPGIELCIEKGGFPDSLDCAGFAFGHPMYSLFSNCPVDEVRGRLTSLGLQEVSLCSSTQTLSFPPESAIIATFVRDGNVRHYALGYLDANAKLEPIWCSKFGNGYPVLLHTLDELDDGDYGVLGSCYVCGAADCGTPRWRPGREDL